MISLKEMERYLIGRYDESFLYDEEEDDPTGAYIRQIILCYIQEMIMGDIAEAYGINYDGVEMDKAGDVCIYIPDEIIDFYRPYFD